MGGITSEQVGEIIPESVGGLSPEWWAQSLRNHHVGPKLHRVSLAAGANADSIPGRHFAAIPGVARWTQQSPDLGRRIAPQPVQS